MNYFWYADHNMLDKIFLSIIFMSNLLVMFSKFGKFLNVIINQKKYLLINFYMIQTDKIS